MARKQLRAYEGYQRGMNDTSAPDDLHDMELRLALNTDLSERGGIAKRKGISPVTEEPYCDGPIESLIDFRIKDERLVGFGSTLQTWDGENVLSDKLDNADFATMVYNKKLYLLNGYDYYCYDGDDFEIVDGTDETDNDLDVVRECTSILVKNQRVFFAGDGTDMLYFSELNDPAYVKVGSSLIASSGKGDKVLGLMEYNDAVLVILERSIFAWYGISPETNVVFSQLNVHTGAVSPRAFVRAQNYVIFTADDGIYLLYGAEPNYITSFHISKQISGIFKKLANKQNIAMTYHDGKIMIACCDGTQYDDETAQEDMVNNTVLVGWLELSFRDNYEQVMVPWTVYTGWRVNRWLEVDSVLYYGDAVDGNIYKACKGYSDAGTPIHFKVKTKPYTLDESFVQKKIRKVFLAAKQMKGISTTDVSVNVDYRNVGYAVDLNEAMVWGTDPWGKIWGWSDLVIKELKVNLKGVRAQLILENNEDEESIVLYGHAFEYKSRKPRGRRTGVEKVEVIGGGTIK